PRINFIALFVDLRPGQQHLRLDSHQRCCHQDKLAGDFDVQMLHMVHVSQEIFCDLGNGDVVDIQFIPFNEEEQQVKRTLKEGQLDLKIFLSNHTAQIYL